MNTALLAAGISAAVALVTTLLAAPLRLWVEQNLLSHKLRAEYEYDQRRELRQLIGRYHGRLVEAAEQLHYRFINIYAHDPEQWLTTSEGFYFKTTSYRVLHVIGLARSFEQKAYYIDARIAEPNDLVFLRFVKAFLWALVDPALFRGLDYDESHSTDHFFADQLRMTGEAFCNKDECLTLTAFFETFEHPPSDPFSDMKEFLLGLQREEPRFRWDRLVVLHLFLIGFLGAVGYATHKQSQSQINHVASQLRHEEIGRNFLEWLGPLGLASHEAMHAIVAALEHPPSTSSR